MFYLLQITACTLHLKQVWSYNLHAPNRKYYVILFTIKVAIATIKLSN